MNHFPFNLSTEAHGERIAAVTGELLAPLAAAARQLTQWHDNTLPAAHHCLNADVAKAAALARQLEALLTSIYDDAQALSRSAAMPEAC